MSNRSHITKKLNTWPFDRIYQYLEYKGEMRGVAVLTENEWNTSKTCSRCGDDTKSNRVERGLYRCSSCELVANADCNGAENMRQKTTPSPHGEVGVTAVWHSHRHTCSTARAGRFTRENRSCRRPANIPPAVREASPSSGSARLLEGAPLPLRLRRGECHFLTEQHRDGIFVRGSGYSGVVQIGPLQLTETWTYALVGGLLALPFTALDVWRSPENITLGAVVVGSVFAGYLIKRRGGNSTATGTRAALIGGIPVLWALNELLWTITTIPNPPWFQGISVVMALAFGSLILVVVAASGALAGRFGGWLAERRGRDGVVDPRGRT